MDGCTSTLRYEIEHFLKNRTFETLPSHLIRFSFTCSDLKQNGLGCVTVCHTDCHTDCHTGWDKGDVTCDTDNDQVTNVSFSSSNEKKFF